MGGYETPRKRMWLRGAAALRRGGDRSGVVVGAVLAGVVAAVRVIGADSRRVAAGAAGLDQFVTRIVLKCVAAESRNALWEFFSFDAERIREGIEIYQWRDSEHVSILHEIYSKYIGRSSI